MNPTITDLPKPKYNIFDEVWGIELYLGEPDRCEVCGGITNHPRQAWKVNVNSFVIGSITSYYTDWNVIEWHYSNLGIIKFRESGENNLFPTKEEAQSECDKRNKEMSD